MGRETQEAIKRLAALLSNKWDREYIDTCRYVRQRLSLILSISFLHLLREEIKRKLDDIEPVVTPAVYWAEMRRTDLSLED